MTEKQTKTTQPATPNGVAEDEVPPTGPGYLDYARKNLPETKPVEPEPLPETTEEPAKPG